MLMSDESSSAGSHPRRLTFAFVGGFVGAMLGYVLRPSVFLIGQLPFGTVITRGSNLSGMDQLLVPAAQASFNLLVAGTVVGVVLGVVLAMFIKPSALRASTPRERVAPHD